MEYILLIISTILVNNIVFAQTLGICPFLGVSSKISSSVGMGAAVVFVITIATLITFLINQYILVPLHLDTFLQTLGTLASGHIPADLGIHPGYRCLGTDGGNHPEESESFALLGLGYLPAIDYYELRRVRCGLASYPEGI